MIFRDALRSGKYIFFDGGMGTMLQAAGLETGTLPEEWNLTHPEEILKIHRAYVEAGSDVITANTFGANSAKFGERTAGLISAAIQIARRSGARFVAQDIGPTGKMLKPLGDFEFDAAYELFKEQVIAGCEAGTDLFIIETMTDLLEMKAAVLAVKENSDLPVIATLSYEKNCRTFLGAHAAAATVTLCGLGVDAVGVNCSLGPADLSDVVAEICRYSEVPVIVQANAGLPETVDGKCVYTLTPAEYAADLNAILSRCRAEEIDKVQIIGGCCGTNPDFIREIVRTVTAASGETLSDSFANLLSGGAYRGPHFWSDEPEEHLAAPEALTSHAIVCSARELIDYNNKTAVVGERLNPTGKKKISAALRAQDFDLLLAEGIREYECGAQILDVNAGLPDIDESAVLVRLITELQGACPLPLQIDTSDTVALEAAVRHYSGKPIINSVNGKEENMKAVLPIAAKYSAALICLTLDEGGIPDRAEDRIAIAEKIMKRAAEYGIPKKNLIIDGLVMTVSTNQKEARETLKTVGLARAKLGLHTCLGVSNISFGLPEREVLNSVFLAEAFTCGLNLPIIDPTKDRYMQTVHAHRVLSMEDEGSVDYITYAQAHPTVTQAAPAASAPAQGSASGRLIGALGGDGAGSSPSAAPGGTKTVADIIISGNKAAIAEKTKELLDSMTALDIINNEFIPALDRVGELYEQGKIFLPQLMGAAETAKRGFDIIKAGLPSDTSSKHMQIVLATVKGDIHDIGKNIVKMLLENYGYEVIDLGKDVEPDLIIKTVKEHNIRLVGLSALMTTTVHNMEETIALLHENCPGCRIMVGGAVLTADLAQKIGADYYSKDAAGSAKIAAEVEAEL
ncbi:MAG: homocysteine S-methyltransferase family protein [Lachnospiraceae bacterium]|nr:homocysteine S-methyltransferase family protein [Lachnospiraceae bacterium]